MPDSDIDDRTLLGRVGGGDPNSLEKLYWRFEQRVFRYACGQLNDPAAAADVLNETMLEVWENAMTFAGRSRVSTWILGIARHKAMDHMRRETRHSHHELDPAEPDREAPPVTDAIAGAQDASRLHHCLARLSPVQREVIHFAFFEELSYTEIATITDVPEGTVKTRVFHAKRTLRRCLGAEASPC